MVSVRYSRYSLHAKGRQGISLAVGAALAANCSQARIAVRGESRSYADPAPRSRVIEILQTRLELIRLCQLDYIVTD